MDFYHHSDTIKILWRDHTCPGSFLGPQNGQWLRDYEGSMILLIGLHGLESTDTLMRQIQRPLGLDRSGPGIY